MLLDRYEPEINWPRFVMAVLGMTGIGCLAIFPSLDALRVPLWYGAVICLAAAMVGFVSAAVDYVFGFVSALVSLLLAGMAGGKYAHYLYEITGDPRIPLAMLGMGVGAVIWAWASLGYRVFRRDALLVRMLGLLARFRGGE